MNGSRSKWAEHFKDHVEERLEVDQPGCLGRSTSENHEIKERDNGAQEEMSAGMIQNTQKCRFSLWVFIYLFLVNASRVQEFVFMPTIV